MSMSTIPDFNDSEIWVVENALKERYGADEAAQIQLQRADSEIRLRPADRELTECPVLYWQARGVNFIIFKSGAERYRCQFFYRIHQQYGTGVDEYDNIGDCVTMLLQMQADHAAQEAAQAD